MTSINTNIAAQTALRTLQSTNAQLDQTQSRISTGLKIGEAKDNAAYWSISTTLKSDNKALGTVKDALNLGAATVDTAYQGLNETLSVLNEITSKLTAATNGNVDKAAVQREITALQDQLKAIAGSSIFAGENWLSSTDTNSTKSIVSGFNRDSNGAVTLSSIDIDTSSLRMLSAGAGLLEGEASTDASAGGNALRAVIDNSVPAGVFAGFSVGTRDVVKFTVTATTGGVTKDTVVTIDQKLVNDTLKVTDGRVDTTDRMKSVLDAALTKAGLSGVTATVTPGQAAGADATANPATKTTISYAAAAGTTTYALTADSATDASRAGVLGINITSMSRDDIVGAINTLTLAAEKVTAGATTLGAVAARFELQQSFVNKLIDTIDQGISGLVDADMNEESTRLQALQVKQQLGVQALSIANQSAQNVLRLFQ